MQRNEATYYTAAQLAARGNNDIPRELVSTTHLIYSSPATLAFNSPGAEGYGVKRAGLSVPDSVMLIVSPGCCGRNTSAISRMPGYEDRFFYLTMDQTDLVLMMTVEPGFGGQKLDERVIGKIRSLKELGYRGEIEADGGITEANLGILAENGLTVAVMGTALFRNENMKECIQRLHRIGLNN